MSSFDMTHSYDENLRPYPNSSDSMRKGVEDLIVKINLEESDIKKSLMKSKVGVYLCTLKDFNESEKYLSVAIEELENQKQEASALVAKIRLATTFHYNNTFGKCDKLLNLCLTQTQSSDDSKINCYKDFVLQHLGKSKMDQKHFGEAEELLLNALDLRILKGDIDLIESTKSALSLLNKIKDN